MEQIEDDLPVNESSGEHHGGGFIGSIVGDVADALGGIMHHIPVVGGLFGGDDAPTATPNDPHEGIDWGLSTAAHEAEHALDFWDHPIIETLASDSESTAPSPTSAEPAPSCFGSDV